MAQLLLKRSSVKNAAPKITDLEVGELALNIADGKIYTKSSDNIIKNIEEGGTYSTINGEDIRGSGDIKLLTNEYLINKSPIEHTHTTEEIVESDQAKLLTSEDVQMLETTITNTQSIKSRISTLNNLVSDGKVKLTADGESNYVSSFINPNTFQYADGTLRVSSLSGVTATTEELNSLSGLTANIQTQISKILSTINSVMTVDKYADLNRQEFSNGDIAIVNVDETHEGLTTMYLYNGESLLFIGGYTGSAIRDFKKDPIDLGAETVGTLSVGQLPIQTAFETKLESTIAEGDNVENGLALFVKRMSEFRTYLGTPFGVPVAANTNITTLVNDISNIRTSLENAIRTVGGEVVDSSLSGLAQSVTEIPITEVTGTVSRITPKSYTINSKIALKFSADIKMDTVCVTPLLITTGQSNLALFSKTFSNASGYTENGVFNYLSNAARGITGVVNKFIADGDNKVVSVMVDSTPKSIIL